MEIIVLKYSFYIILSFIFFISCKKKEEPISVDFHYDYSPSKIGVWNEFKVTEITHTSTGAHDTNEYFIKEIITELISEETFRIERFKRISLADNWEIKDVWVRNFSKTQYQQTEENITFSKLIFPIKENQFWDGNAFNIQEELTYEYANIHTQYEINNLSFDSTVTVIQQENSNAIEYQISNEVFAKGVGLIYKQQIDLDINFFDKEDINEGTELEMRLINYGN